MRPPRASAGLSSVTLGLALLLVSLMAVSPSRAGINVLGGLSRELVVQPGARSEGRILLRNSDDRAHQVRIYQTDYRFWSDGRSEYAEPGTTPRSNATWLTITPSQVSVPAGATEAVYYSVSVPDSADLSGTYWSIVMVEPVPFESGSAAPVDTDQDTIGLQAVVRYGVQIVTSIGDTGARKLRFIGRQLVATEAGRHILQLDAECVGERWLVPLVWTELYDQSGALVGRFEGGKRRIYQDCSVRYQIDLTDVPAGHYKALVVADNGDDNVFGAQYELELP